MINDATLIVELHTDCTSLQVLALTGVTAGVLPPIVGFGSNLSLSVSCFLGSFD